MKLIAIILTTLFLSLTLIPCTDGVGTDQYDSEMQYNAGSGNGISDVDYCSPFCGFSCQTHIILQQPNELQLVLPYVSINSQYPSGSQREVVNPILQPPKA